ncbi:unnamed protein product [Amoebophrya sp. A120]|nr:unnamed protein product [Amoebophrya sp. A120]|eukprot:GSA120T00000107001.1
MNKGKATPLATSNLQPVSFAQTSLVPQLQTLFSSKARLQQVKHAGSIAAASQEHFDTLVADLASDHNVTRSDVLITIKFDSLDTDHNGVLDGEENAVCPKQADLNNDGKLDFAEHGLYCSMRTHSQTSAETSFTQLLLQPSGPLSQIASPPTSSPGQARRFRGIGFGPNSRFRRGHRDAHGTYIADPIEKDEIPSTTPTLHATQQRNNGGWWGRKPDHPPQDKITPLKFPRSPPSRASGLGFRA